MVIRFTPKRNVPSRFTIQRTAMKRTAMKRNVPTRQRSIIELKREKQKQQQFLSNLSNFVVTSFTTLKNINNINSFSNNLLNTNLSNVPQQFKEVFRKMIRNKKNNILREQNIRTSTVQKKIARAQEFGERAFEKKRTATTDREQSRQKAEQERQEFIEKQSRTVLDEIKKGKIFDISPIFKKIGNQSSDVKALVLKQQIEKTQEKDINKFILQQEKLGKEPSLSEIKQEFKNLSLSKLTQIKGQIKPRVEEIIPKTETILKITESINKGALLGKSSEFEFGNINIFLKKPFKDNKANDLYQSLDLKDQAKVKNYANAINTKAYIKQNFTEYKETYTDFYDDLLNLNNIMKSSLPSRIDILFPQSLIFSNKQFKQASLDTTAISKLLNSSNRELANDIINNRFSTLNRAIDQSNKLDKRKEQINNLYKKNILKILKQTSGNGFIRNIFKKLSPIKALILWAGSMKIRNDLKDKKEVTKKDIDEILKLADKIELPKKRLLKLPREFLNWMDLGISMSLGDKIKFFKKLGSGVKKTASVIIELPKVWGRDLKNLADLGKKAWDKALLPFLKTRFKYFINIKNTVPKAEREKAKKNLANLLKSDVNKIKNAENRVKNLFNNPEIITRALALGILAIGDSSMKLFEKNPKRFWAEILDVIIDIVTLGKAGTSLPKRTSKFIKKLPLEQQKMVIAIFKVGKEVSKANKKVKIKAFNIIDIVPDKRVRKALMSTARDTKAILFGSVVEYQAKIELLKKFYKITDSQEALRLFKKDVGKDIFSELIKLPNDLDYIIEPRHVKKIIESFNTKYRPVTEFIQKFYARGLRNTGIKGFDLGLGILRKNKKSVLSAMTTKQIDELLKAFSFDPVTAAFKYQFLQKLFEATKSKKLIQRFEIEKLALEGTDFALDLHSIKDLAFTREFLGIFRFKKSLPFEKPVIKRFKSAFLDNTKQIKLLELLKKRAFDNLARKYKKTFSSLGLNISGDTLRKNVPKWIEKLELGKKVQFDFLVSAKNSILNKKILDQYYRALNLLELTVPKTKFLKLSSSPVPFSLQLKLLLNIIKRSSRIIKKYDATLDFLKQAREVLLFYSQASRKLIKKVLKFEDKTFKLNKTLSVTEQEKLLKFFEDLTRKLNKTYSIKELEKQLSFIKVPKGLKQIVKRKLKAKLELGKTLERSIDLQFLKNFKTEKIGKTKEGLRFVLPTEQVKRRIAGAVSTIFESRRTKDIKKLHDNAKFIEALRRLEIARKKPNIAKIDLLNIRLKNAILNLKVKTNKLLTDAFRKTTIINTKGLSETTGLIKINLSETFRKMNSEINKALKVIKKTPDTALKKNLMLEIFRYKKSLSKLKKAKAMIALSSLMSLAKSIRLLRSLSKSRSVSASKSRIKSISKSISKSKSQSKSKSKSRSKSRSVSKSVSVSKSKSKSKSVSKSKSKSKSTSKSDSKSKPPSLPSYLPPSKPPIKVPIPFIRLDWNTKLPKGTHFKVNGFVKVGNKRIKVVKGLPRNKAWNRTFSKGSKKFRGVDNSTPRSFEFVIVGTTKAKDDSKRIGEHKVRKRMGKDKRVLINVEKTKFAIDTKGEKQGLKIAKKFKPKHPKKKKNVKKSKKTTKNKTKKKKKKMARRKSTRRVKTKSNKKR